MSGLPVISIVTPSFNQAEYLQATMASVLDQGYERLEYVVVDAASTDGSAGIVAEQSDRLAWWVSEPDAGHTDGLNKGFAHTSGEVMGWVNSSDLQLPWTLRTVGEVFRDLPEVQWVVGLQTWAGPDGVPREAWPTRWNRYDFIGGHYAWLQQESVFWRRSLWERAGGRIDPAVRYACDFSLWLRFMDLAPLYHLPLPLGVYRAHEVRRGTDGGAYGRETRALWEAWVAAKSAAERRRGRIATLLRGRPGELWREALARAPIVRWFQYPTLRFDQDLKKWVPR